MPAPMWAVRRPLARAARVARSVRPDTDRRATMALPVLRGELMGAQRHADRPGAQARSDGRAGAQPLSCRRAGRALPERIYCANAASVRLLNK